MKKRGFTLIEIIVTIGLLAIIGVGIGVSLNKVFKNQEEESYETFIEKVKSSTLLYSSNEVSVMNNLEFNSGYVLISKDDLIKAGYIKSDLKNPETNEKISDFSPNYVVGEEDYTKAKLYYSVDKELIVEYPYINTSDNWYLNVINYTTTYKSNEDNLCYKGLDTSSLGLVDDKGQLKKGLIKGESIIAYMEDGSLCNGDNLNTYKVGTHKIKYVYDYDEKKGSANRIITIKAPKPEISGFTVNVDTTNHKVLLNAKIVDTTDKPLSYCIDYSNKGDIKDCDWKELSIASTNSFTLDIDDILNMHKSNTSLYDVPIYLFVKNSFEEYVREKSNVNVQFRFNIKFDSRGGSACSNKKLLYGEAYGTLCTPTRTGYTFKGWYTAINGGGQKITSTSKAYLTSDQTLYAYWIPNKYTLTYNNQSGSGCTSKIVTFGSKYGTLCTPSRTGYTFNGWYTGTNGSGSKITSSTIVKTASNHTVYAKWEPNTYTLIYDNQGGSGCSSKTVTYDSTYGTLCTPTRKNYTFRGWYTGTNGTGTNITSSTKVNITSDLIVYAKWELTSCTLIIHLDTINQTFYNNVNKSKTLKSTYVIENIKPYTTISAVLNSNSDYKRPITNSYYFTDWTDVSGSSIPLSTKLAGTLDIYAKWAGDTTNPTCSINISSSGLSGTNSDNASGVASATWSGGTSLSAGVHSYNVKDYALNTNTCSVEIKDKSSRTESYTDTCTDWYEECTGGGSRNQFVGKGTSGDCATMYGMWAWYCANGYAGPGCYTTITEPEECEWYDYTYECTKEETIYYCASGYNEISGASKCYKRL